MNLYVFSVHLWHHDGACVVVAATLEEAETAIVATIGQNSLAEHHYGEPYTLDATVPLDPAPPAPVVAFFPGDDH